MLNFLDGLPALDGVQLFRPADGKNIDRTLVDAAIKEATDSIYSFEACFETTYGEDQRSVEEMLRRAGRLKRIASRLIQTRHRS